MSATLFDRQRAALARLTEAAAARAAADAELAAAFQTARDKAELEIARARKAHAAALERDIGALDAQVAAAQERLGRDYTTDQINNERTREERRKLTTERFNAAQQRGQTEYKDKKWSLDSLLEAGEKAAKDQLESLQRKAAAGADRAGELAGELEPLLK